MKTRRSDIAFTPSVKAIQARKGSRDAYRRMEEKGGWRQDITDELAAFIAEQRSFFIATVSSDGAPYIQHRGGPRGFLHVIGPATLAFADFKGNRQFISQGNLEKLMPGSYQARHEQVVVFEVFTWDVNCPQHIPVRIDAEDVQLALAERDARIAELKAKLATAGAG